ncbi:MULTISPECIES: HAD-IA family hydrolase [unclassified Cupriavidus]|uniref:HAD-IA family hydrolase n=1 Tax=unclassified Cupriavidus TaxID=2640874 RepID=UPI0003FDF8E0|nr:MULTISPECIES: HAD-IA family hydrolase [unclassified Cupriavidus]MBP0630858.1 HAD-IA family hydrolase [Cupriavidus sp. AcVe19-1a]MBP0634221.1 HAD-IA family hydrolase [Cupriavidus sp. AcVe19-6a]
MHLSKVSAISFDLDDTLWPFGPAVARAEATLLAWLLQHAPKTAGVLTSPAVLRDLRASYEGGNPHLAHDYRALRIGSILLALEMAGEDASLAEDAYDAFFAARQQVEFFEDALPALEWLSARFPLVAVSNGNADLKVTGGHHFFRAALSAGTFGTAKPAAAIFHAAAAAVDTPPEEMLHVGDDPDLDVVGALDAGLQAAWLVRPDSPHTAQWQRGGARPHLILSDLQSLCRALAG